MGTNRSIAEFIRNNKTVFIVILIVLFLVELEIFALAVMKSGRISWLQVVDSAGVIVHETDGDNLSEFNKYYFERTFGPFEDYDVQLMIENRPFPFRGWFAATLGVPIGTVLLLGFIFKAYWSIFHIHEILPPSDGATLGTDRRVGFDVFISRISQMNIYVIGFFVFIAIIVYLVIPDMISHIGKTGLDVFERFKWLFICVLISTILLVMWFVYLKYRLAKKTIDNRKEIEKYKLQLGLNNRVNLSKSNDGISDNASMIEDQR